MSSSLTVPTNDRNNQRRFATTRWSLVLQARGKATPVARLALSELCEGYWMPVYTFIRHRCGNTHDAQDLTQSFFADLLERQFPETLDSSRGRFRSFLMAAAKHFLSHERAKAAAVKRGGSLAIRSLDWAAGESRFLSETTHEMTAERLFEREWAVALLSRVMQQLKSDQQERGKGRSFEVLSPFLSADRTTIDYASAAGALGVTSDAVRVATHRLRKRYRELLRAEVSHTTRDSEEVEDELRQLFVALTQ